MKQHPLLIGGLLVAVVMLSGFFIADNTTSIPADEIEDYARIVATNQISVIPEYELRTTPPALATPAVVEGADETSSGGISIEQDVPRQDQLKNPPSPIRAIYATSWSASSRSRMRDLLGLIRSSELNAIVIDIKDFSGYIAYDSEIEEVERYGAEQVRVPHINALIKQFHDAGIYVIGRVSVFQDPILAEARPDLAVQSLESGGIWRDRKGLAWTDAGSKEVWDYNIAIAREAADIGFDEINFDYVRFPSDGVLSDMVFTHKPAGKTKADVMHDFYAYVYEHMQGSGAKTSADLFGLTTTHANDLGIGQIIENAYPYFDYIAPMVYPSHYASGFLGIAKPAEYPYDIVEYSNRRALQRFVEYEMAHASPMISQTSSTASTSEVVTPEIDRFAAVMKLRPWLQDFDLGADYDAGMVRAQITATYDAACKVLMYPQGVVGNDPEPTVTVAPSMNESSSTSSSSLSDPTPSVAQEGGEPRLTAFDVAHHDCENDIGWMLWDPRNVYTRDALLME